ncbi:DegT/DnrJ/EryC1/StrS family aminotransferase [Bacillus pacificus]
MATPKDRSSYSAIYAYSLSEEVRNKQVIEDLKKQKIEARLYFSPSCHQQVLFRNYKSTDLTRNE